MQPLLLGQPVQTFRDDDAFSFLRAIKEAFLWAPSAPLRNDGTTSPARNKQVSPKPSFGTKLEGASKTSFTDMLRHGKAILHLNRRKPCVLTRQP